MKDPMNTTKTELLEEFFNDEDIKLLFHDKNYDKWYSEKKAKTMFSKALDRYRDIVVEIVESKKLPVPNKYGTTVKVKRYNEVMDEILTALKQTNNNTTKEL